MSEQQNQPDQEQLERIEEQKAARAAALARREQQEQSQRAHINPNEIMVSVLGTNLISNIVYELNREKHSPENNPHLEWCDAYENGTALPPRLDDVFNGTGSFGLNYGGQGHMAWLSKNYHARALANTSNAMYNFIMKSVCATPKMQHGFVNQILFYIKMANAIFKANPRIDDDEDDETYTNRILGLIQRPLVEKVEKVDSKVETKPVPKATLAPTKAAKPKAKPIVEETEEEEDEIEEADEEESDLEEEDDDDDELDDLEEEEDDGWATKKKARPVAKQVARPAKVPMKAVKKVYSRKN